MEASTRLNCSIRTIERYIKNYLVHGTDGLRDKRGGNNRKLTKKQELEIIKAKKDGKHRSARFVRDKLNFNISEETVRRVFVEHHLNRISLPPVKPVKRFVAASPNDLWQIDFMGKVLFPFVGELHLLVTIDDCSRFIHYGRFYPSAMRSIWRHFNRYLAQWVRRKYKRFARHKRRAYEYINRLAKANSHLFVHWKLGIFPGSKVVGAG